jgi:hypothetical protein
MRSSAGLTAGQPLTVATNTVSEALAIVMHVLAD